MPSDVVAGHECPQHDELTTGSELTADPLPRFLEEQAYFGGGRPPRTFNFTTAGRSWRLYYRHLGGGGIAFPDSEQEEHFRRLTDVERWSVASLSRSCVRSPTTPIGSGFRINAGDSGSTRGCVSR
jgi:hypothetical protein